MLISCLVRNAVTKEWIPSADVTLLSQDVEEVCVQTDLNGLSQLSAKAGRTFVFRVKHEGFRTREVPIRTTEEDLDLGIIDLDPEQLQVRFHIKDDVGSPLEGVTVVCSVSSKECSRENSNSQGVAVLSLSNGLADQRIHYTAQRTGFEPATGDLIPNQKPTLEIRLVQKQEGGEVMMKLRLLNESKNPLEGGVVTLRFGGHTLAVGKTDGNGIADITLDTKYADHSVTYQAECVEFQPATGVIQVGESNLPPIILKKVVAQPQDHWKTWKRLLYVLVPWVILSPYLNLNLAISNWFLVGLGTLVLGGVRPISPLRSMAVVFLLQFISLVPVVILSSARWRGSDFFISTLLFLANALIVGWICRWRRRKQKAVPQLKKVDRIPSPTQPEISGKCSVCGGKGWIYKKSLHELAQYAGSAGKEPCPSCRK